MRLWPFSSSVNSFFKRTCATLKWRCMSDFLVRPFIYFHTSCVLTAKALARLCGCAWAFTGCLCDKYHNLMSWLNYQMNNRRNCCVRVRKKCNDQEQIQSASTSCPWHQMGKEYKQLRWRKAKQHKDNSFPADGHQTILNKRKRSRRQTECRQTMAIRINHNKSTTLERSVINF